MWILGPKELLVFVLLFIVGSVEEVVACDMIDYVANCEVVYGGKETNYRRSSLD
jgi:hypothetical protein